MKDVFGRELSVGDKVATNVNGYTDRLTVLTVVGFTAQKVKVAPGGYGDDYMLKFPKQLAKADE